MLSPCFDGRTSELIPASIPDKLLSHPVTASSV